MSPLYADRPPFDPALAAEEHLNETMEAHAIVPPADFERYRLHKAVTQDIGVAKLRQSELQELGNEELVARCQKVIEELETIRRGLARG